VRELRARPQPAFSPSSQRRALADIAGEFAARCSTELTATQWARPPPQLVDSYGLVAVFVAGVYLRRYELEHGYKRGSTFVST
jgi:hypothetical protein